MRELASFPTFKRHKNTSQLCYMIDHTQSLCSLSAVPELREGFYLEFTLYFEEEFFVCIATATVEANVYNDTLPAMQRRDKNLN